MAKPISLAHRQIIEGCLRSPVYFTYREIGEKIGRSGPSVNNEVAKNGGRKGYSASKAYEDVISGLKRGRKHINLYELLERIENLEMQIEILTDIIKGKTK